MTDMKQAKERYAGWKASPAVYRVHTVLISAYCTLMLMSSMTVFDDLREIVLASLVVLK
jgi:hypothetical protein